MEFKKFVLENGLTVIHEKRDVPVATVMLAVKYGSGCDSVKEKGMAHFIEHLCFKGTAKRTVMQISSEVESVGGELNAFTAEDITAYHVKLPSRHLNIAMDVLFDIFFNASFPVDEIEKEGQVICEEIKMYSDNPRAYVLEKIRGCLYAEPFGMFGAGTIENVKSFSRDQLYRRHREVYSPKNSVLCVVGNCNFEEIVRLAKNFSVERNSKKIKRPTISLQSLKDNESRDNLQQTNLAMGFHFPFLGEKERYSAEIFSAILGEGMSSKLFSEVREKRGLVYGIKSDLDLGKDHGYMVIFAGMEPEKKDAVLKICLEEFSKMKNLTSTELETAKEQVIGNKVVGSENSNEVAVDLIMQEICGNSEDYYSYEKHIREVSLKDIKNLASKSDYAFFSLGPKK